MTKIDSKMLNADGDAEALRNSSEDQRATLEQERNIIQHLWLMMMIMKKVWTVTSNIVNYM